MADLLKDRKVFNFGGFRGMDTENKPDKVERFRAISGKNFYIDSGTLKTRPSLINNKKYDLNGKIIGSYFFNDIEIIFTNTNRIYFLINGDIFYTSGSADNANDRVFTNLANFNFATSKPFFVQEKECLFVFCINDVYVISHVQGGVSGGAYVVYPIDIKLPFDSDLQDYCSLVEYEKLPYSYIPTIQIGDNAFEDVNLLSNKRKYKLFSKPSDEKYTTYDLLGDFQPDKNGDFKDVGIDVNFYGQDLKAVTQIPVFEGVQNDVATDFTASGTYWLFPPTSTSTPALTLQTIPEIVLATEIWEYLDTDTDFSDPIYEKTGLTKEKALTLKMTDGRTVFEYLRDFDLSSTSPYYAEMAGRIPIYRIKVKVEHMYRLVNSSGLTVSAGKKHISEREVFFSIQQFSEIGVFTRNSSTTGVVQITSSDVFPVSYKFLDVASTKATTVEVSDFAHLPSPVDVDANTAYKTLDDGLIYHWSTEDHEYCAINNFTYPITLSNSNNEISLSQINDVLAWFKLNNSFNEDINESQVKVKFTNQILISPAVSSLGSALSYPAPNPTFNMYGETSTVTSRITYDSMSYPYVNFLNPFEKTILTIEKTLLTTNDIKYKDVGAYGSAEDTIEDAINRFLQVNNTPSGSYIIRFYFGEIKWNSSNGQLINGTKYTLIFNATVSRTEDVYQYRHWGHNLQFVKFSQQLNPLYELKENDGFISLKLANILINYKNEPAIDVELTFPKNDYNKALIANNKFGVSFGSEYRIFLAGNPEFKHIDRYNISNDLLGNNIKNQSYELSYFPSKQYRVVGGSASAINGYVVATDTQLYVTKTQAINDSCLYIRTRTLGDDGIVTYFEYKTNIMKTPINERCIVNFYNDIVILTKDGLLGVEISSNVLTNERLLKLRSGFINKDLINAVKNAISVWCIEDNERLYIFADSKVYVADARYIEANENAQVSNVSYEIVKWELDRVLNFGFLHDGSLIFYDDARSFVFEDTGRDKVINVFADGEMALESGGAIIFNTIFDLLNDNDTITFSRKNILDTTKIILAKVFSSDEIVLTGGKWIITQEILDTFAKRTNSYVEDLDVYIYGSDFTLITDDIVVGAEIVLNAGDEVFFDVYDKPLYIKKTASVGHIKLLTSLRDEEFYTDIGLKDSTFSDFSFFYNVETPIKIEWYSGILDFSDKLYEKTMFEITVYARRLSKANILKYGYRTLRGYKEDVDDFEIDLSNSVSFDENNFNIFAVSTFDNVAITRKQKENNFLYIQFIFKGEGNVEISDIIVYYKNNRKTKSVS